MRHLLNLKSLFACAAMIIVLSACSDKRAAPSAADTTLSSPADKSSAYLYPHNENWKTDHVEFYAKNRKQIEGSTHDCVLCHSQRQNAGTPKNLSCAVQCHAPISTPDGSKPIDSPITKPSQVCFECHKANFTRQKHHYPAATGLCTTCHTVNPSHLTDKSKASVTTDKSNESCLKCHSKMDTHSEVHKVLITKANACIYCHDPHGSTANYFTRDKMPELCLDCHGDLLHDNAVSLHGIIPGTDDNKRSCANCHSPHSSDVKPLLLKEKKSLCIDCHDREYQTKFADGSPRLIPNIKGKITGPNFHRPAKDSANCAVRCHTPHDSQYAALLKKRYPVTPYEKYSPGSEPDQNSYDLCMLCHEDSMLSKEVTAEGTAFRNDIKTADGKIERTNLHWFHVVNAAGSQDPSKGRSCFVCHDPHGSEQEHNIKTSFRLNGTTNVNIVYKATATGGSCAMTCHSDDIKKYNRVE